MKHLLAATLVTLAALPLQQVSAQTVRIVMHSDLKILDPTVSTQ